MAGDRSTALETLNGCELASVVFVRSYLQLTFDGPTLNAYVWPTVIENGVTHAISETGYRDALCQQIGKRIVDAAKVGDEQIVLRFADGSKICFSLLEDDQTGPEAVLIEADGGKVWDVW